MLLVPVGDLPVYLMPYVFVCDSSPVLKAQSPTLKITKETNIGIAIILINMFLTLNVSVQNDLRLVPEPFRGYYLNGFRQCWFPFLVEQVGFNNRYLNTWMQAKMSNLFGYGLDG